MSTERQTNRITNPDQLAQHEELGRKIAAALEPLGLSLEAIQMAASYAETNITADSAYFCRSMARRAGASAGRRYARAAGVAAYFEAQAAKLNG